MARLQSGTPRSERPPVEAVVAEAKKVDLSARDTYFALALLKNPPPPSPRLVAAAQARLKRA